MEAIDELKGYMDEDGKFHRFPGKRQKKKQALMLAYLAKQFKAKQNYTEQEINEILSAHHTFNDPATLRRLLFGSKFLDRTLDGRRYWLVEKEPTEVG